MDTMLWQLWQSRVWPNSHHQLEQSGPPEKYRPLSLFYSARFICFWLCVFCFFKILYLAMLGLSCSMWGLIPWPGIKPGPPALGVWSLSHWTTREVPILFFLIGIQLLYHVVLVSSVQQRESALCMHIFPPSRVSLLPSLIPSL